MGDRRGAVDAMVIGAQKAGTSWLWDALRRHPGVFSPPVKELHYYDHRHCPANRAWTGRHLRRGVRRALRWHAGRAEALDPGWIAYLVALEQEALFTPAWYRAAFARAPAGALRLDATPEYASLPPNGAAEAARDNPGLRAIHILRDPVDRALSQIRMGFARRGIEAPTRADWDRALQDPDLADRGAYARHLAIWGAVLPAERLLRLDFAGLAADPDRFLTRAERFLDLPPGPRPEGFARPLHAGPALSPPPAIRRRLAEVLGAEREAMDRALAAQAAQDAATGVATGPAPEAAGAGARGRGAAGAQAPKLSDAGAAPPSGCASSSSLPASSSAASSSAASSCRSALPPGSTAAPGAVPSPSSGLAAMLAGACARLAAAARRAPAMPGRRLR